MNLHSHLLSHPYNNVQQFSVDPHFSGVQFDMMQQLIAKNTPVTDQFTMEATPCSVPLSDKSTEVLNKKYVFKQSNVNNQSNRLPVIEVSGLEILSVIADASEERQNKLLSSQLIPFKRKVNGCLLSDFITIKRTLNNGFGLFEPSKTKRQYLHNTKFTMSDNFRVLQQALSDLEAARLIAIFNPNNKNKKMATTNIKDIDICLSITGKEVIQNTNIESSTSTSKS